MLTIVGCGNCNRRDDGVGVYVAQKLQVFLKNRPNPGVRIFDAGTAGMDVMFQARGSSAIILVDANRSGSKPGSIFEVPGKELENRPEPSYNLHDFRWDHALYAGKRIFKEDFPSEITVYLIEVADLGFGLELSPEVQAAATRVCETIQQKIVQFHG